MQPEGCWVVMAPTASEGIYREVATFSNEADAAESANKKVMGTGKFSTPARWILSKSGS